MDQQYAASVRRKILEAAKEMFLSAGYRKTTIQKIVEKSGVSSGSIYHWYHNKQEIFQALVARLMQEAQAFIEQAFGAAAPSRRYAALLMMELSAIDGDAILREMFAIALASEEMLVPLARRHAAFVGRLLPGRFPEAEAQRRCLLIHASMHGYVLVSRSETAEERAALARLLVVSALTLLGVPQEEAQRAAVFSPEEQAELRRGSAQLLARL